MTRGVVLRHFAQHRVLGERLVERHVERRRNLLGDAVDVRVRHVHHAADVADDGLGLHRAERDDLRDVLASVLLGDVGDHLAAAPLAEVDVDIGQRHALGIEEALENQVVVERIDVGDSEGPGGKAAGGRAAARSDRNALLARVADEIPHDHEVPGIPHLLDHRDLVREPLVVLRERVPQLPFRIELPETLQALRVALPDDVLEVIVEREALGDRELRQVILAGRDRHVAALGDEQRVLHRVGIIAEHFRHLRGGLEEELIAVVLQAL